MRVVEQKGCVQVAWEYFPKALPCTWSLITLDLEYIVHSPVKKTVECGNHYNVSFITLQATTESPVPIRPHGSRRQQVGSIHKLVNSENTRSRKVICKQVKKSHQVALLLKNLEKTY